MENNVIELQARVANLERRLTTMTRGALFCLLLIASLGLVAFGHPADTATRVDVDVVRTDKLVARTIVLEDVDGKTRGKIALFEDFRPELRFYDGNGKERVALGLRRETYNDEATESAGLMLFHSDGRDRVLLRTNQNGSPGLFLWDATGQPRALIGETLKEQAPSILLRGKDGKELFSAPTTSR